MKSAGVITGFLPGTPYAMGEPWPNMEEIVEHNYPSPSLPILIQTAEHSVYRSCVH